MTREEEIKERHDTFDVQYFYPGSGKYFGEADADMQWIIARNEELQWRAIRLESGILHALDYWNRCEELGAMSDALHEIEKRLYDALDAKEQDDD